MIVSLGYDRFRVMTATWGFFALCGFFLLCLFVRSLLYLVSATSRELPVSYIEHAHRYHHIPEPPATSCSPCFAPLPTLPQLSLGCERAAIRVSLSGYEPGLTSLEKARKILSAFSGERFSRKTIKQIHPSIQLPNEAVYCRRVYDTYLVTGRCFSGNSR